jgi:hypothetical protein
MIDTEPLQWPKGWPRQNGYKGDLRAGGNGVRAGIEDAIARLTNQLDLLNATNVVLTKGRNGDPGVAIYFHLPGQVDQLSMAQDAYGSAADNFRSLAIAIEGLRAMERHGGAHMMKRAFSGFAALPPPASGPAVRQWWEVLGVPDPAKLVGVLTNAQQLDVAEAAYRKKVKDAHPDRGGSQEAIAELNAAIAQARGELK